MLVIDKKSKATLYEQLYGQLREQIIRGQLAENTRLSSTRSLAKTLGISRNTVESAYQQLYAEGYISSKAGSGYRVEKIESNMLKEFDLANSEEEPPLVLSLEEAEASGVSSAPGIAFQYGRLRLAEFPVQTFRRLVNQALLSADAHHLTSYNDGKGELDLRMEITKYLYESRGVRCSPEQIILCSGSSHCMGLLSQLLMKHTKEIALEEPCYETMRSAFINHGFQVLPIPVEKEGIALDELRSSSARAVCVTPSHQFPTGVVMPINKRLHLIQWAAQHDAFIIEDDYDSEFRYSSRPIPSLHSLDSKGRVIYINTFSKSFAPGIRLSFMVLPMALLKEYSLHLSKYDCSVPWLEQKAMYAFMKEGHWHRHLRRINVSNKKKHDVLIHTITAEMGHGVTIYGKNAGLHILLEVNNGFNEKELLEKAAAAGVTVYPVSNHYAEVDSYSNNQVLIGFSSLSEEDIVTGIKRLKRAWF